MPLRPEEIHTHPRALPEPTRPAPIWKSKGFLAFVVVVVVITLAFTTLNIRFTSTNTLSVVPRNDSEQRDISTGHITGGDAQAPGDSATQYATIYSPDAEVRAFGGKTMSVLLSHYPYFPDCTVSQGVLHIAFHSPEPGGQETLALPMPSSVMNVSCNVSAQQYVLTVTYQGGAQPTMIFSSKVSRN